MQQLWNRLENWLATNAPSVLAGLRPGATETEIREAEEALGVTFPEDFKASWQLHDGQERDSPGLMDGRQLLSLERMMREWGIWTDLYERGDFEGQEGEANGPVHPDWWNPKWIPLTYDGAGNHDCLDLDPAEGGQLGQIIDFWHDAPSRTVEADSFRAWLTALTEGCESGEYLFSVRYHCIAKREDV